MRNEVFFTRKAVCGRNQEKNVAPGLGTSVRSGLTESPCDSGGFFLNGGKCAGWKTGISLKREAVCRIKMHIPPG